MHYAALKVLRILRFLTASYEEGACPTARTVQARLTHTAYSGREPGPKAHSSIGPLSLEAGAVHNTRPACSRTELLRPYLELLRNCHVSRKGQCEYYQYHITHIDRVLIRKSPYSIHCKSTCAPYTMSLSRKWNIQNNSLSQRVLLIHRFRFVFCTELCCKH